MDWYWDAEAKEEVIFAKDGNEYMWFNLEIEKITYCKRATESFAGETGTHGELPD